MASKKKAETKAAAFKAEKAVVPAPVKETEVKTEAPKKAEAVTIEAAPKKAPVKKAPAKKTSTVKAEVKTSVYVQYACKEVSVEEIIAAAKKAYVEAGHKDSDIKTFDVYVKPEENTAYYVVNGEGSDDYKIEF